MPINLAWGPTSLTANVPLTTPALTVDPTDTWVALGADLSGLAAGIAWNLRIDRRRTSADPWEPNGETGGLTIGGPDHNRQGGIVETGLRASLPNTWTGLTGRQVRAVATLGVSTTLSGHVSTGS